MRQSLNSGLTGSEILDFILMGIAIGAGLQCIVSALSGKMPGPGIVPAGLGGGLVAAILFVFKSGMEL